MKVVNMSRKDELFWSLNIAASLLIFIAVYLVSHSDALAGVISGRAHSALLKKGIEKVINGHGCEFALAWTLVFTACYQFRGSLESLKKGMILTVSGVILTEVIRLLAGLPLNSAVVGLFVELFACALGGAAILLHEKVLI